MGRHEARVDTERLAELLSGRDGRVDETHRIHPPEPDDGDEIGCDDDVPAWAQVPTSLAGTDVAVRHRAVAGVVVLALVVVALLTGRLLWQQQAARPHPTDARSVSLTGGVGEGIGPGGASTTAGAVGGGAGVSAQAASPGGAGPAGGSAQAVSSAQAGVSGASPVATGSATVYVHVIGAVQKPGVVELPAGSRVAEAVERAGGVSSEADARGVNLARPVVDGEQVMVPTRAQVVAGEVSPPGQSPGAGATPVGPAQPGAGAGSGGASGAGGSAGDTVDLNAADQTALEELPGVGPVLAERIAAWRTEHGRFTSVEELGEVSGIGEKMLENLRPHVRV